MASLGEVGEGLNKVLDKAVEAGAALQRAVEWAEEARDLLKSAAHGSLQTDVETANAQFTDAIEGMAEPHRHLGAGVDGTQKILHGLELDWSTPTSAEELELQLYRRGRHEEGRPDQVRPSTSTNCVAIFRRRCNLGRAGRPTAAGSRTPMHSTHPHTS